MPRMLGPYNFESTVVSGTALFLALGPRISSVGVQNVDYALSITNQSGDAKALAGNQFFSAPPKVAGTPNITTGGAYTGTVGATVRTTYDASSDTSEWTMQNGVWLKLDGGTTAGSIQGQLSVIVDGEALSAGDREIEVSPNEDASHPSLFVLGPYLPLLGASNFRAVINGTEVSDMSYRFYARGADDPTKPQPITALGAGFTDTPADPWSVHRTLAWFT